MPALIMWQPAWSRWVGTLESLLSLSLLIATMSVRVMIISEQVLENGTGLVTMSEIVNFIIVGGVAWVAYQRAVLAIRKKIDAQ